VLTHPRRIIANACATEAAKETAEGAVHVA
jgi:hypothetical protein